MPISRREFVKRSAAVSLAFGGLELALSARALGDAGRRARAIGYGPLEKDDAGVLDLPRGFRYTTFSRRGDAMDDGLLVPGRHDGMAAFAGAGGKTILVRNHEITEEIRGESAFGTRNELLARFPDELLYDRGRGSRPGEGCTTTVVFDTKTQRVERQRLSLAGTVYNCAGGATPWGSWLSCEETVTRAGEGGFERDHGYVFEVPADATTPVPPLPLKAMGRFRHEACAVDAASGVVYLTEDREDGLVYRFIPKARRKLVEGGRLQALAAIDCSSLDARNWPDSPRKIAVGTSLAVRWIDMEEIDAPKDDLRARGFAAGAARFARCEGMWSGKDGVYFAPTEGGSKKLGQVWRYRPGAPAIEGTPDEHDHPGTLELFCEPDDTRVMENADNITMAPWGDLIVCEDGPGHDRLLGITPAGEVYTLARNARNESEFAGCTFSPDGTTLFVNMQDNGLTLAITGDWKRA